MITALRHFLVDSWLGRVVACLVFLSFLVLGGTFFNFSGGGFGDMAPDQVAKVGDHSLTASELEHGIRQQITYLQHSGVPLESLRSPGARQEISQAALRNVIVAREGELAAERNGVFLSDDTIRASVFAMPEFRDEHGQFSAERMDAILKQNNLDHQFLIDQTRRMLFSEGTMFGFGQSAQIPAAETEQMVRFFTEGTLVDMIRVPFDGGKVSAQPDEAKLHRFYDNHPWLFQKPEYRHARIVAMTSESVISTIEVPDTVLRTIYEQRSRDYNMPETRTVQVLGLSDERTAYKIAQAWRSGTTWDELQKTYSDSIPASLNDARESDFPDDQLGKAAFAVSGTGISDPVKTAAGWSVVRVLGVHPAHSVSFEQVKNSIRSEVQKSEASVALKAREKMFEEAVAGSTTLDQIPSNLGAVPLSGKMDAHGLTVSGSAAPLPGDQKVRQAIIQQVFSQSKGDLPHVIVLSDGTAFAVLVDDIEAAQKKSFDAARSEVVAAWIQDAQKRDVEARVTALYQKAKASSLRKALEGQPELDSLRQDEHFSRLQKREDVSPLILRGALQQKVGQTAMLQDGNAFWLVNVTGTYQESPDMVQAVRQKMLQQQAQGMQDDMTETLGMAYTREVPPRHLNSTLFNQVSGMVFDQIVGKQAQQ